MLTVDSHDQASLRLLIMNPEREGEITEAARASARSIRDFFVRERGWDIGDLARYRFRDLADLARGGEIRLARTVGTVDWSRRQDDFTLQLTLREMRGQKTLRGRRVMLARLTGGETVATVLEERRVALSKEEWASIDALIAARVGRVDKKSRESGAQLGQGIKRLLEGAYGR